MADNEEVVEFNKVRVDGRDVYVNWKHQLISVHENGKDALNFDHLTKMQINQIYWGFKKFDKNLPLHKVQDIYNMK